MIPELLFIFTYCKEQPVSIQLNPLIAIDRATSKLPAGHSHWPLWPKVTGKGADQPRAMPWMHHNMQNEWGVCDWSMPSAALAHSWRHQFCTATEISAGREGGRRGSRSTSLSRAIILCQLMLFMEFQLSPDNSTVCQIDRPPPGLHWQNMQQCQPTKSDTPALNREQQGIFFALHLYFVITSTAAQWCGL